MIITVNNRTTEAHARRLDELITRWPRGLTVRHVNGWTGQIAADDVPGRRVGYSLGVEVCHTAHALVGHMPHNVAVCVERVQGGRTVTAWYRPGVLTPVGKDAPALPPKPAPKPARQRQRTTRRAA